MQRIDRSPLGGLIARVIAFMRVLPTVCAGDVPFDFNLTATTNGGWIKERLYHFENGRFEFRSVMRMEPDGAAGELVENFSCGAHISVCMKIRLAADTDTLYFFDDGYFLRWGTRRRPIPRWLGVGRFTLAHTNIDRENFRVEISIDHPWFGRLFHQSGEFRAAPVGAINEAINAGAATPAPAHKAACATMRC